MSDHDWRGDLLDDLPQARIEVRAITFPNAYDLMKIAAYNRRMYVQEFIGRAAAAVAVYDADQDPTWLGLMRLEPPIRDLRRHNLPLKRQFGRGFGPWEIGEMR